MGPAIPAVVIPLAHQVLVLGFQRWWLALQGRLGSRVLSPLLSVSRTPAHPILGDITPGGHAGVGVVGLHGAPPLPSICSLPEGVFSNRPCRVVLPLGNGGVAHLFVISGNQGAEIDPEKLALTGQLLSSALAEAKVCCSGQPVILEVDLNVDPPVIPSSATGMADGAWIDVERAFALGRGVAPSPTCQFQLDEGKGTRRDFALACPIALAAITSCCVRSDRWLPHFGILCFAVGCHGEFGQSPFPIWPACWIYTFRSSASFLRM